VRFTAGQLLGEVGVGGVVHEPAEAIAERERVPSENRSGSVGSRGPGSRAVVGFDAARARGVSRSTSGKRPDVSRSKSTHGFAISTRVTRTPPALHVHALGARVVRGQQLAVGVAESRAR